MGQEFINKDYQVKKVIKVLHIFAPNFKNRFGGPVFNWKYYFSNWNNTDVEHYVLDYEKRQLVGAKEAFNFEYSGVQTVISIWGRAFWVFTLFGYLIKYKGQYDILHLHVLWWGGLLAGLWSKWVNIPAIYESVLLDFDTPGGILKEKFGRIKVCCLKNFKAILAISEYLAEDYRKSGFSISQVFTLMNCVDVELFSPVSSVDEKILLRQQLNLPPNATILLFVGSIKERKGVDVLIRAFAEVSSKFSDLFLLMIGPKNPDENSSVDVGFINDMNLFLKQSGLLERVFMPGLIHDRKKLVQIYRTSDIFVFPSRNEGLPNVVLEAMSTSLPVVVSQLPGIEQVIKQGENGLIVPIGDVDALKDSIIMLRDNPGLAIKMGISARDYVQEEHGFSTWQSHLVQFYKGLL